MLRIYFCGFGQVVVVIVEFLLFKLLNLLIQRKLKFQSVTVFVSYCLSKRRESEKESEGDQKSLCYEPGCSLINIIHTHKLLLLYIIFVHIFVFVKIHRSDVYVIWMVQSSMNLKECVRLDFVYFKTINLIFKMYSPAAKCANTYTYTHRIYNTHKCCRPFYSIGK